MNTEENKVSIIIPFYNRLDLLQKSITSVLNQTHKNIELILVNDGSVESITKIEQLAIGDTRIRLYTQENKGVAAARNFGISKSTGEYIAFLDSDDLWESNKLEIQLSYMLKHNYLVSHTSYSVYDLDQNKVVKHIGILEGNVFSQLIYKCEIATPTVMVKREVLTEMKYPFCEEFHIAEDTCLFLDLTYKYPLGGIDIPLTNVYQSTNTAGTPTDKRCIALVNILNHIFKNPNYISYRQEIKKLNTILDMEISFAEITEKQHNSGITKKLEITRNRIKKNQQKADFFPKVAIIIPVYNGGNYVKQAIDSALSQTYPNIEVIVINDGSDDCEQTDSICLSYRDKIRYFSKQNGGVATALNLGISKMTGDYFSWLSHDDLYTEDKIERQIETLTKLEDKTTIINGGYEIVDANLNYIWNVIPLKQYTQEQLRDPIFTLLRGLVHGCTLLVHKSHFQRIGLFDASLPTTQDFDLWFRMFRGQNMEFSGGLCVKARSHEEQGSKAVLNAHIKECDRLWIRMIEELTTEEMCRTEKDSLTFLENTLRFLVENSGYIGAIRHLKAKIYKYQRALLCDKPTQYEKIIKQSSIEPLFSMQKTFENACTTEPQKRRIAFLLGNPNLLGGLNRVVLQMASALTEKYDVYLISAEKYDKTGYGISDKIKNIVFLDWNLHTEKLMQLLCFSHIHLTVISYNCDSTVLSLYGIAKDYGIHTIAWNHEFYYIPYFNSDLQECLNTRNQSLSLADAAIWLTNYSAWIYGMHQSNSIVIPNPNTIQILEALPLHRSKNIVSVGRFDDPRKGLKELLYMFSKVCKKNNETRLCVVGSHDLSLPVPDDISGINYEDLIKKLGIPIDRLYFTGLISDVSYYYEQACINILPSSLEGFGLTLTEAAVFGLPSMVFDGSGLDDIITDSVNGYIIPQGDSDKMAEVLLNYLSDSKLQQQMQEVALENAKRYEISNITQKWSNLIEMIFTHSGESLCNKLSASFGIQVQNNEQYIYNAFEQYEKCILLQPQLVNKAFDIQAKIDNDSKWLKEYNNIKNSLSWKITKPLRLVKRLLLSAKNK